MNPFIISGFEGKEFFCDRIIEIEKLKEAFLNQRNVTLVSLRRMGKSSLIKYVFGNLDDADCIYIDIYSAQKLEDMVKIIANSILVYYSSVFKDFTSKLAGLFKSLQASLLFDEITGKPELNFSISKIHEQTRSLEQLFDHLENSKKPVLIALDEFQSILKFPEKNTEAILRTIVQKCRNVNFIFSGSNHSMMQSIFSDKANPFYQSTQFMFLKEIDHDVYKNFILEQFEKNDQKIEGTVIDDLLNLCRHHTYYVQLICNRLYSKGFDIDNDKMIITLQDILRENEPIYYNYKNLLNKSQWNLVNAIAKEDIVKEPHSGAFIKKYNLVSSSSVQSSLKTLLKDEMVIYYNDAYIVYDVFFSLWMKINTMF